MRQRGLRRARGMRHWADRKYATPATPDGLDRSSPFSLARLMDEWIEQLAARHYSPRTLQGDRWAQGRDLLLAYDITRPILESYQRFIFRYRTHKDLPLSVTAQRRMLLVLRRFFAWLTKANFILANPASELEIPRKQPRLLPRALSQEQVMNLLALPDISDPLGLRDRAILEVLYATGMRRRELVMLDVEDLDHERLTLRIRHGKGGRQRLTPLGTRALLWLGRYLAECRPQLVVSSTERALFLSGYGQRFNVHYVGNWVRRLMNQLDIPKGGSCHLLRHSCATHMLENGADIRLIGQLLGHARLDTTQIYTELDIRHLREVHARTHPSAQPAAR
jgi:integrase/recombinase XerD